MTTRGTNPNPASTQKPQATTVNLKTQKLRLECQHNVTLDYSFKQIRDIAGNQIMIHLDLTLRRYHQRRTTQRQRKKKANSQIGRGS